MTAQCNSGWEWASNSMNQNPCAIAGALEAPCRGLASYTLGPLNNTNYVAPPKGSALPCECNTVMYSLFMACTDCQGEQIQTWNFWAENCDAVYVTQYPLSIPDDTAIPHWAYLNVTSGTGTWDESASEAVVDQPESTGIKPPVATLSTSTGTSNGAGEVSTSTSTSSHSSGGGSNAGAIAGGVVGGLAALGVLAALAVWFFMKKKRSKVPPSSAFVNGYQTSTDPDHLKYDHPPVSAGPSTPPPVMYNPSDPSTFPTALHDPSIGTGYPQTLYDPHAPRRGQYSGAPEI